MGKEIQPLKQMMTQKLPMIQKQTKEGNKEGDDETEKRKSCSDMKKECVAAKNTECGKHGDACTKGDDDKCAWDVEKGCECVKGSASIAGLMAVACALVF